MFVDEASITVAGGNGGDGCSSFRREKFVPRGGPDGGSGGHGGSVILVANRDRSTLLQFRHHTRFEAERGRHGQGANKTGRSGEDCLVQVPVGTVVLDLDGTRALADLTKNGQRLVVAKGGGGGRGNATYASSIQRAPTRRDPGWPGDQAVLRLELKLLADVGLLGFPNAGKSTLLSRISAARPKIADYPFTTLVPQLGVVDRGEYRSFVVADIPGLIEGAHQGAGLGHRFLRHVERCRLLLHLIDPTDCTRDPVEGVRRLNEELRLFRPELATRPQLLVLTKADAVQDNGPVEAIHRWAEQTGEACRTISAVTGEGLTDLIREIGKRLDEIPAEPTGRMADDD